MTQQLEHGPSATEHTANTAVTEPGSGPFSYRDLARIDEALTMSSKETGIRFTLYLGDLGRDTRATAEDLHSRSGGDTSNTVLLAVSPGFQAPAAHRGAPRLFVSHGERDGVLPIEHCSRRIVPQLERAGYDVRYREFDGPHTIPATISPTGGTR